MFDAATWRRVWLAAVCSIGGLQILIGLSGLAAAGFGFDWERQTSLDDRVRAFQIVGFSSLGLYLLLGARRDPRIEHLGVIYILIAEAFAYPPGAAFVDALSETPALVVRALRAVTVDAFLGALLWLFFRDFPRALEWPRTARVVGGWLVLCFGLAAGLILANVALAFEWAPGLRAFDRSNPVGQYWLVVFGLALPLFPFQFWRLRHATLRERRRVRLFLTGLLLFGLPQVATIILLPLSETVETFVMRDSVEPFVQAAMQSLVLASAAWTTYAVVVQRVLGVRAVLRNAAQYALARSGIALLAGIPFLGLLALLYRARDESLANLFMGVRPFQLLALVAVGVSVLWLRRRMMSAIDRIFFRETYDARRILAGVAEQSRGARSTRELAESLIREVDRALHVESIGLLGRTSGGDFGVLSGPVRPLAGSSSVIEILERTGAPLAVDLARPPLDALPRGDRVWIADTGAEVLVPLSGSAGALKGLLSVGARRSEQPYTREDLLLLDAIGSSSGIALENRQLRDSPGSGKRSATDSRHAAECGSCGWVGEPDSPVCGECDSDVRRAQLPHLLFDTFRVDRVLGEGAMGVVYRARDVELGRDVALKTLPARSPEDAALLRREARAMAAITHPNLAVIFGTESWRGIPLLVIEYLPRGTLDDRLDGERLDPCEALELGLVLAAVLDRTHRAGILHRDVKPSNIGYAHDGTPKLLDFGLARLTSESRSSGASHVAEPGVAADRATAGSGLVGTPLYMSPQALGGARPDPTMDLWSAAVVVFEALAGAHPFERATSALTFDAIHRADARELRELWSDCPKTVADIIHRTLAADQARRPQTARDLAAQYRAALGASSA